MVGTPIAIYGKETDGEQTLAMFFDSDDEHIFINMPLLYEGDIADTLYIASKLENDKVIDARGDLRIYTSLSLTDDTALGRFEEWLPEGYIVVADRTGDFSNGEWNHPTRVFVAKKMPHFYENKLIPEKLKNDER